MVGNVKGSISLSKQEGTNYIYQTKSAALFSQKNETECFKIVNTVCQKKKSQQANTKL